jgi:hypothetical protein
MISEAARETFRASSRLEHNRTYGQQPGQEAFVYHLSTCPIGCRHPAGYAKLSA